MTQLSFRIRTPAPSGPWERSGDGAPACLAHSQGDVNWGFVEQKVDVREILRKLWRGRRLILLTVFAGCLLGYSIMEHLTPLYTASSSMMFKTRQMQVLESDDVLSGLALEPEVIEGEIELLHSRELAEKVVKLLSLYEDPEFNTALAEDGAGFDWSDVLNYLPAEFAAYARELLDGEVEGDDTALTAQGSAALQQIRTIDTFLEKLDIRQVGQSPVIRISFSSESPLMTAEVANTVAETYFSEQLVSKYDATRRASNWLEARIAQLRAAVAEKEQAIEEFRARSGLIEGKDLPLETQQMSELASQVVVARVERQAAESRLQQVERAPSAAMDVLRSELIQGLRIAEAELRREFANLGMEYGPNHPGIINARARLDDIQTSIDSEIERIVLGLRNEVDAARRREAGLQATLDDFSRRVARSNSEAVELRDMEREVEARRTLLESLLARLQETARREGIQQADAQIISAAEIPEFPAFPNKKLFMALTFCASAFAGVSLAYVLQALDQSFHTAAQVTDDLDLPVLELVPSVRGLSGRASPADFVVQQPTSSFAEALRSLQVALYAHRCPPTSVLFTSSLPGEGKTSLTLAFGRFLAMAGHSVIVVDCDLRRSSVHAALGGRRNPGLVDHLLGRTTLDQVIQLAGPPALHFIASGSPAANPPALFASQAMHATLSMLTRHYDVVLIDSAPVLAVADTRCLQPLVERTVFIVRWRTTQRATAREAVRRLHQAGLGAAGAVLNLVDPSAYGEYDPSYSYKALRSYYAE
jgi:capsular exopolysaccharide synthesis family protein